jgi:hypothetical protein
MGLGLTISKMILQQLDGTISVESEPSKGSRFTFKIPISDHLFEESKQQSSSMIHHRPQRNNGALFNTDINRNNSKFIPLAREALVNNSVDQEFSLPEIGESDEEIEASTLQRTLWQKYN